ncbi:hypothetical protein E2C01_001633 [Portunus trituberculatus]|uniref:Uncharacterized protein n=1 Tax=Portunus trituberculatus TaxID=210409 RepID=A0A5B7CJS0_PORTR|nr:hypothetical protein [Portunus trituberculatus]
MFHARTSTSSPLAITSTTNTFCNTNNYNNTTAATITNAITKPTPPLLPSSLHMLQAQQSIPRACNCTHHTTHRPPHTATQTPNPPHSQTSLQSLNAIKRRENMTE